MGFIDALFSPNYEPPDDLPEDVEIEPDEEALFDLAEPEDDIDDIIAILEEIEGARALDRIIEIVART